MKKNARANRFWWVGLLFFCFILVMAGRWSVKVQACLLTRTKPSVPCVSSGCKDEGTFHLDHVCKRWYKLPSGNECRKERYECDPLESCCDGGGCFTSEVQVDTPEGEREIKDLKEGEGVVSFNEETGEEEVSIIDNVYEVTRSAYYKLTFKDGTEMKVTAEHPLYAVQQEKEQEEMGFWEYIKTESLTRGVVDRLTLR